ncbi:MAG: SURF1 family protein [Trueperaceae bacterium]|nr:SURF1 family protein [Trueperaceae bacterium]
MSETHQSANESSKKRYLLLSPRWLAGHALALLLVATFITLGFWQLQRLEQRTTYNALLESRLVAEPRAYEDLRDIFDPAAPSDAADAAVYRQTEIQGRYDPEHEVLWRSRSYESQPGYHVLTPLVFADGQALLVDRGWVPYELDEPPIASASPPAGIVTVRGILFPGQEQPTGFGAKDPLEGELDAVFWIDPERLAGQMPYGLEPLYLQLAAQRPAQTGRLPVPPSPPELGQGPHLGYAIQWFALALVGIVGYAILMRNTLRDDAKSDREDTDGESALQDGRPVTTS